MVATFVWVGGSDTFGFFPNDQTSDQPSDVIFRLHPILISNTVMSSRTTCRFCVCECLCPGFSCVSDERGFVRLRFIEMNPSTSVWRSHIDTSDLEHQLWLNTTADAFRSKGSEMEQVSLSPDSLTDLLTRCSSEHDKLWVSTSKGWWKRASWTRQQDKVQMKGS